MSSQISDRSMEEITDLLGDFSVDLSDAIGSLIDTMDRYEEGWEDRILDCAIGLTISLQDLLEKLEIITGERWVDFGEAELVNKS